MPQALTLADGATVEDQATLSAVAAALSAAPSGTHVAGVSATVPRTPLLERAGRGDGWAVGRYAGRLTLDDTSVLIEPRMGWDALDGWAAAATGLHVPSTGGGDPAARLIALASTLWVRAVDGASRHGPPAFRRDVRYVGGSIRGHLDVRRTVRLRAKGASTAASVYRTRELDNPVTRIIVAADRVLMRQVGQGRWRTDRVDSVLAQLKTAVGRRAAVPGDGELHRMRYTPITRPFKWAAELSSRIVRQDPVTTTALRGRVQGLVLDLDGIYGEAALNWAREARPDLRAERLDSGQVVLRDRRYVRAMIGLRGSSESGAPMLTLARFGATAQPLPVPTDAAAAAREVLRALAEV